MKRALPIALSLLLCHCGTEVGNGVAPEEPKTEGTTAGNGSPTSAPQKDESAPDAMSTSIFASSFIAACASPFAETMEGTFANSNSSVTFQVTAGSDGKKTVSRSDNSLLFVITPAPSTGTYAIEALSGSPQVTCSAITSQTLASGSIERSVTLSDGALVQWTLSAGKVVSMKLTTAAMAVESWAKK